MNEWYNIEVSKPDKKVPAEKNTESEKENKIKEKAEEQEKFYSRDHYFAINYFQLSGKDKFVYFGTILNNHPFNDDVVRPPQAV